MRGNALLRRTVSWAVALALFVYPLLAISAAQTPPPRPDLIPVCTGQGLIWIDLRTGRPDPAPPRSRGPVLHLCCFLHGKSATSVPTVELPTPCGFALLRRMQGAPDPLRPRPLAFDHAPRAPPGSSI